VKDVTIIKYRLPSSKPGKCALMPVNTFDKHLHQGEPRKSERNKII